ncbi:MAG: RDD family protein, partial [Deinococcales bacterium]|nr:RDD family protein [Chitinophagaceae bacterium]
MSNISIVTPQNIELEYELGSIGDRIVAGLIDFAIIIAYCIVAGIMLAFANVSGNTQVVVSTIIFLPVMFYSLLSELLMHGQTVGKRVINIKVISLTGNQPNFSQYLIRWLFRLIDIWLSSYLLAIIIIAISEKRQRLGDIVANTTLIKTIARASIQQTIYVPIVENNYKVTYPEVINLKDTDIQLIKEILLNIQKSSNT